VKLQLQNEFVSQTIITAKKLIHVHTDLPPNSTVMNWKNLTLAEWKVFIPCQINMGQHIQPTVESDWYTNPPQYCPRFQNMFPRDCFPVFLTFFHVLESGNVCVPGELRYDPYTQFEPFIENVNGVFGHLYAPDQQVSVDEKLTGTEKYLPIIVWSSNYRFCTIQ
jgi:hypothetical protein